MSDQMKSTGLEVVAWAFRSPLNQVSKLQWRKPCMVAPEEHGWRPLTYKSDAAAIITSKDAEIARLYAEHAAIIADYAEGYSRLRSEVERLNAFLNCRVSWDGNNVYGDVPSIEAVNDALHAEGMIPDLRRRINEQAKRIAELEEQIDLQVPAQVFAAQSAALAKAREALEYERDAIKALMSWCAKNVDKWDFPQYDNVSYAVMKRDEALADIDALTQLEGKEPRHED